MGYGHSPEPKHNNGGVPLKVRMNKKRKTKPYLTLQKCFIGMNKKAENFLQSVSTYHFAICIINTYSFLAMAAEDLCVYDRNSSFWWLFQIGASLIFTGRVLSTTRADRVSRYQLNVILRGCYKTTANYIEQALPYVKLVKACLLLQKGPQTPCWSRPVVAKTI